MLEAAVLLGEEEVRRELIYCCAVKCRVLKKTRGSTQLRIVTVGSDVVWVNWGSHGSLSLVGVMSDGEWRCVGWWHVQRGKERCAGMTVTLQTSRILSCNHHNPSTSTSTRLRCDLCLQTSMHAKMSLIDAPPSKDGCIKAPLLLLQLHIQNNNNFQAT